MSKAVTVGATALLGCILCATPLSLRLSSEGKVSLSIESASALDAGVNSIESASAVDAGVNRRAHRRAHRLSYYEYDYCGQTRCDY